MRSLVLVIVVSAGCGKEESKPPPPTVDRSFGMGGPPPDVVVPETIRQVMPVLPGTEVLYPLGRDQFDRGWQLTLCSKVDPVASANAAEEIYRAAGWTFERNEAGPQGGPFLIGTAPDRGALTINVGDLGGAGLSCPRDQYQAVLDVRLRDE